MRGASVSLPALVAVLSLGLAAGPAQGQPPVPSGQDSDGRTGASPAPVPRADGMRSVVRGQVQAISMARGSITLGTDDGLLTIRARPDDARRLKPGDFLIRSVIEVGGALWLERGAAESRFPLAGALMGRVDRVQPAEGIMTVIGETVRAHPAVLVGVEPGQVVSVLYVSVGGSRWAEIVRAEEGGPAQAGEQPAAAAPAGVGGPAGPAPAPEGGGGPAGPAPDGPEVPAEPTPRPGAEERGSE